MCNPDHEWSGEIDQWSWPLPTRVQTDASQSSQLYIPVLPNEPSSMRDEILDSAEGLKVSLYKSQDRGQASVDAAIVLKSAKPNPSVKASGTEDGWRKKTT